MSFDAARLQTAVPNDFRRVLVPSEYSGVGF